MTWTFKIRNYIFATRHLLILLMIIFKISTHTVQCMTPSPVIRKIHITRLNVFETEVPEFQKFPFPLINKLHIKTKETVIRRELLFKSATTLNPSLLEESERNLRALQFIGKASITPHYVTPDSVDVQVVVQDLWTTAIGTKYDIQAGKPQYGVRLEEYNLLGWGQQIKGSYAVIDGRTQKEFYLAENRFAGTRFRTRYHYKGLEYGQYHRFQITRPFYAEHSQWSIETNYEIYRGNRHIYNHKQMLADYAVTETAFNSRISRLIFHEQRKSARLSLLYHERYNHLRHFNQLADNYTFNPPLPNDRMIGVGVDAVRLNYLKERFINQFGLIEDVAQGWSGALYCGRALNSDQYDQRKWYFLSKIAGSRKFANLIYLYGRLESYAYLTHRGWNEAATNLHLRSYLHKYYPHTFVSNMEISLAWHMPKHQQLFLGENRGLRGYANYFKTGQNRIIINLEDRLYPNLFFYSFGFGAALFTDIGYIWNKHGTLKWQKPFIAAGIGLRIGNTKTKGAQVFRLDLAITFKDEPQLFISFGNRHFFSAFENFSFVTPFPVIYGENKE